LNVFFYTIARVTFAKQPTNVTRLMSFLPHACISGVAIVCSTVRQRIECSEILMLLK
jgi:hypothetical protein